MPRTTLDLDPSVLRELRRRGRLEGKSMGRVASEVLARALAESEPERQALAWISHDLGLPRVDLEDKEAVRATLDGDP
jgi:plasmid stability protein